MKAKKWLSSAMVLTLVGGLAAGCGSGNDSKGAGDGSGSSKPQEININYSAEPPILDSSKGTAQAAFTILNAFNEGLYRADKDGKMQPALAAGEPEISEDKLTYTIKIRDDAKWSDGEPVKAQDFVYSYRRTVEPSTKAQYAFMVAWIKGGSDVMKAETPEEVKAKQEAMGVKAIDDKTLEITLEKPVVFFKDLLAFPLFFPQRQDYVEKYGDKYGADFDKIIGAGPFKLTAWDHEAKLILEKNDKYWDANNVKLTKATVNIVKDQNSSLNMYETNAADVTILKGEAYESYKDKPDLKLKKELTNAYIMFQTKNEALKNQKIRQALDMAIDRQAFVDTVLKDGSKPSTGFVPFGTNDGNGQEFRKTAGDTQPKPDKEKAKQLLEEGLKEAGLSSMPTLKLMGDDTETAKKSLEFLVAQWSENLGIKVETEPVPHALRLEKSKNHDFDMVLALWGADYNDPMSFLDLWITGSDFNEIGWSNPKYDELIKQASVELDPAERAQQFVDAEKILMEEMPLSPLYFRTQPYAVKENIEGLLLPGLGMEWDLKYTFVK